MRMIYLPNTKVIIQDDAERTIIATVSNVDVEGVSLSTLAKAMAVAPMLMCFIDDLPEPIDFDIYKLGDREMRAISKIRSAFTDAERVELTHYRYMLK